MLFCATLLSARTLPLASAERAGGEEESGESERTMRRFVFRLREGVAPEVFGAEHGLRLVGQVGALRRYYEYEATERTGERAVRRGSEWSDADPLEGSEWAAEQIPRVRVRRVAEAPHDYSEPQDPMYGSQVKKGLSSSFFFFLFFLLHSRFQNITEHPITTSSSLPSFNFPFHSFF